MKRILERFRRNNEEGDVVQSVIIIAVFAIITLVVGGQLYNAIAKESQNRYDSIIAKPNTEKLAFEAMAREVIAVEKEWTISQSHATFEQHRVEKVGQAGSKRYMKTGKYQGISYLLHSRMIDTEGTMELVLEYNDSADQFEDKKNIVSISSTEIDSEAFWKPMSSVHS